MVDDMLGFEDDYVAFTTLPEAAKDFMDDPNLWEQSLEKILEARKKILKILHNKTKGLDFFSQNRIIYVLQKNIVKNNQVGLPYFKYFDFANISQRKDNKEEDFLKYKDDKDMVEVINRLRKDKLTSEEFKYVSDLYNYEIFLARKDEDHKKNMARQKKRLEKIALEHQLKIIEKAEEEKQIAIQQSEQKAEEEKQKAEQEKQKAEQEKQKAEQLQIKLAKVLLQQGETTAIIAETLEISLNEALELIERIKNKEV